MQAYLYISPCPLHLYLAILDLHFHPPYLPQRTTHFLWTTWHFPEKKSEGLEAVCCPDLLPLPFLPTVVGKKHHWKIPKRPLQALPCGRGHMLLIPPVSWVSHNLPFHTIYPISLTKTIPASWAASALQETKESPCNQEWLDQWDTL